MSHRRKSYRFGQTQAAKRTPPSRKGKQQSAGPERQRKVLQGDRFAIRQRLKQQRRARQLTWVAAGLAVLAALLSYLFV